MTERGALDATQEKKKMRELELELIDSQMAQKPVLRGEVGVRALRARSESREGAWASAGL